MNIKRISYKILLPIVYFGFSKKCNVCGSTFRKFKPHGHQFEVLERLDVIGGKRIQEGKCPFCSRTERERLLYWYVFESGEISLESKSVLHVAPESSLQAKFISLKERGELDYRAGDLFTKGYQYECESLDITDTGFEDNTFDLVICNHVLEHIPDDKKALAEIFRLLKKGGKAILQVPISYRLPETLEDFSDTSPVFREKTFGQFDHVRIYGSDYPSLLSNSGFVVSIKKPKELIPDKTFNQWGLNPRENIFTVQKPLLEPCVVLPL